MSREVCGYCGLEVPCGCKGAPPDWIEWHGGEQPVADDVVVEVKLRSGIPSGWGDAKAAVWDWSHDGGECDIIAYRIVPQDSELDRLRAELERERMRLAACGVVASANTPETAAEARKMHDDYRSASCDDVAAAVDREMRLRKENARLREALELAVNHLDWIEWGGSWERECVRDSGDMEKINAALQGAKNDQSK